MTTRLDRLFLLLDSGSTPLIRKSAAEQLGDVQKLHPYELNNLLTKVNTYLRSTNWDTRIAASQAVNAIARNVPQWEPRGGPKQELEGEGLNLDGKLRFSTFDLSRVLHNGASLLGSEGNQFNTEEKPVGMDDKEYLIQQRQMLNKRLGLDIAGSLKLDLDRDLFTDDDLVSGMKRDLTENKLQICDIVQQQGNLSSREKNRAKRKAKLIAKQSSRDSPVHEQDGQPPSKKLKSEDSCDGIPTDQSTDFVDDLDWQFDWFCEALMGDLFNSSWEIRHGAATGLREIIKLHGRGAGKSMDTPADQMLASNQLWLSDLALRLLCVIALDRFGDFVSDEVVAPVRETCSQTLGVVMKFLEKDGIQGVLSILLQLLSQQQWEVRHGGLLGIKYLLAVRMDMTNDLLPAVLPFIYQGLQDIDDDVRGVAASALIPVADNLVETLPLQVPVIASSLWEILVDLDDLTASTNSIMVLLSTLLAHPKASVLDKLSRPLFELVPRLWPFLRHNIISVRKAALNTLNTLLNMQSVQHPAYSWLPPIIQPLLRHIFQRALLETSDEVLAIVDTVWAATLSRAPIEYVIAAATPWLGVWLSLAMQPSKIPYDNNYLIEAKHKGRSETGSHRGPVTDQESPGTGKDKLVYIAGNEATSLGPEHRDGCVMRARTTAAKLIGHLCGYLCQPVSTLPQEMEKPVESLAKLLIFHLSTKSAIQRIVIAEVVHVWANIQPAQCPDTVKTKLLETLNESVYYDEIGLGFTRMQTDCRDFIATLKQQDIDMDQIIPPGSILTPDQALALVTQVYNTVKSAIKPRNVQTMEDRRSQLHVSIMQIINDQQSLSIRTLSSLAKAVVALDALPEKLNPVIRPLMDCIKKEMNEAIQRGAAVCLSKLLRKCASREPCPNGKVLKNLGAFVCCNPCNTPVISMINNNSTADINCDTYKGNLTLAKLNKVTESTDRRLKRVPSVSVSPDLMQEDSQSQKQLCIQQRGGEMALTVAVSEFGDSLPKDLPSLWETILQYLKLNETEIQNLQTEGTVQDVVNSLHIMEVTGPSLPTSLSKQLLDYLPCLQCYMRCQYTGVRHMAARVTGMLSTLYTAAVMVFVIEQVLPMFESTEDDIQRQGASEVISNVIEMLNMDIIPYIVLLIVPVLGRMSDQNTDVRTLATSCFATLIRLLPLEAGVPDPPDMNLTLVEKKLKEREFLEQLMDGSKLENYKIDVPVKADLRKYQQDGVNWLGFLNKYKLHGILCDDMGLGKTLQSICIMASDHFRRAQRYKETKSPDATPLPSIVVCPPTLIGHWVYEVNKFVDRIYLNPLMYAGTPADRIRLQKKASKHNLIVASYDVVRNDIDFFGAINWNYCILDEGHIIKNGKTKISKAVKQLNCNHRLILSGTPIQNNVFDLWSLFDFLVPGFLGTERQFQVRYGKPILASREAKSSSKEQEAGALAMETLHRQVLPFILRRLKEDVLQDLPPKIIQDYYCDLSPLQVKLYEDFSKTQAQKGVEDCIHSNKPAEQKKGSTHVFQALQYLRKVCNHPALVLNTNHPKYDEIMKGLNKQGSSIRDVSHAPKLTALRQLLLDCGIGVDDTGGQTAGQVPVVNQHRVLLFCQLKSMLNIVETDLLKGQMPSVTYLRLDGSVPAGSRHDIVNRFNNDPSIDILLLTTHVGGLGLNLTGADTVIFVEHDWNPMKDLQAMDRAHRIGQKKVVNVYRLVTRGTLEEKIMGLQKFKLTIANTVISQDNSSLMTMGTSQLLDLFALDDKKKGESSAQTKNATEKKETAKSILENLEDLWEDEQYESEYDIQSFMKSLV